MSRFEEFVAKVNEGGELSDELRALVAESGSVSGDALIRLASSHGIDLSLDELRTALTGATGSELSEDELEAVAGGTRPFAVHFE